MHIIVRVLNDDGGHDETAEVVRQTQTMIICKWRNKEIRFSKKQGKPLGRLEDRLPDYPFIKHSELKRIISS